MGALQAGPRGYWLERFVRGVRFERSVIFVRAVRFVRPKALIFHWLCKECYTTISKNDSGPRQIIDSPSGVIRSFH